MPSNTDPTQPDAEGLRHLWESLPPEARRDFLRLIGAAPSTLPPDDSHDGVDELREGYRQLIRRYRWSHFLTLTYRFESRPGKVLRDFSVFRNIVSGRIYPPSVRRANRGVAYCLVIEKQVRDVVHFHLLLDLPGTWKDGREIEPRDFRVLWPHGSVDIQSIYDLDGVIDYITKKTTNDNVPVLDGNLQRIGREGVVG